jgi:hypothetical protein
MQHGVDHIQQLRMGDETTTARFSGLYPGLEWQTHQAQLPFRRPAIRAKLISSSLT